MSRSSFHSLLAPVFALVAGCAATGGGAAGPSSAATVKVVLAAQRGCCGDGRTAAGLASALRRRADLQRLVVEQADSRQRAAEAATAARAATAKARVLYLSMRMDAARKALDLALSRVRAVKARGISATDLGAIYLLLAAVSDARGQREDVNAYCRAAVRYHPEIQPDPDTFPPPVREAVASARRDREVVSVSIQSTPPGSMVTWDGRPLGRTPVKIPKQSKGEHFLVVEHPLYAPREEVIYLSTGASLQVELKPASPAVIAGAIAREPQLADDGLALLGIRSLVWIEEAGEGKLAVRVHSVGRNGRSYRLGAAPAQVELDQAVEAAVADAPGPKAGRGPQRPSVFRRYWWAWSLGAAAVIAAGIAIPVAVSGDEDPGARGVRLDLP